MTATYTQPSPVATAEDGEETGDLAFPFHQHGMPPMLAPTGLTGAVAASRYVGATASGHPTAGTFAVGDVVVDQTGAWWFCTVAGTPGTWVSPAGPALFSAMTAVALTDAATVAVNAALGNLFRVTLAGNRTLGAPTNPTDGQTIDFEITQDGTGSRTLAYASAYEFSTTLASPTLSTAAGKVDLLSFRYSSVASKWRCKLIDLGFAS
jgi:hypothetical protein